MRIDVFLKKSRLIKRRVIAQEACTKGLIMINDKVVKQSANVSLEDTITLTLGNKEIIVKVTSLLVNKDALMYELINEKYLGQN